MSNPNTPAKTGGTMHGWPWMQSFQSELNRMLDRFGPMPFGPDTMPMPPVDVADVGDAVEVTAELPGIEPEDLDVTIAGETLVLRGEKSDRREESGKDWHHVERSFGSFRRQIPLGFDPLDGKVDTTFEAGVLTLRIAKPADAATSTRKIEVSTS